MASYMVSAKDEEEYEPLFRSSLEEWEGHVVSPSRTLYAQRRRARAYRRREDVPRAWVRAVAVFLLLGTHVAAWTLVLRVLFFVGDLPASDAGMLVLLLLPPAAAMTLYLGPVNNTLMDINDSWLAVVLATLLITDIVLTALAWCTLALVVAVHYAVVFRCP